MTRPPRFTPHTLRFLRALKRNNRRDWFNTHRDDYETHVRAPMIGIIERLAVDFRSFAPDPWCRDGKCGLCPTSI